MLGIKKISQVEEIRQLLEDKVGGYIDSMLNERLLSILSTKENVNMEILGFEAVESERYQAIVTPIDIAGERLGTLFIYRNTQAYSIDPDTPLPAASCLVQDKLGLVNATCFDIAAACSGFIYALDVARQYVLSGAARKVLVAGSEKMSAITDWTDRTTCILFGDGAGAVVVERSEGGTQNGILSTATGTDGSLAPLLRIEAGGSARPTTAETLAAREGFVKMDGHAIFKYAVRNMAGIAAKAVADAGLRPSDVDWFVPHQANMRIIQAVAKTMELPPERVVVNIERTGNTTAASIPLALHEAVADGRIKDGDNVLFGSFGAGLTWGAAVVRWGR